VKGFGNIMKGKRKRSCRPQMAAHCRKRVRQGAKGSRPRARRAAWVDGRGERKQRGSTAVKIDPEVVNKEEVQMLEDLVLAAPAQRGAQENRRGARAAGASGS